jgi:hypothetical protein
MKRSKVVIIITLNHDVMASCSLHMTLNAQCGKRSEEDISLNHDVYDIIPTPQVTQNSQIWGRLGRCNSISVHPYARLCIPGEFPRNSPGIPQEFQGEDPSLKHDLRTSFSLDKRPRISTSGVNLAGVMVDGCTHCIHLVSILETV